jgi:hypothetical protein
MFRTANQQWLSSERDKDVIIRGRIRPPLLKVAFERFARSVMQGNEAALLELRASDNQTVRRDIRIAQMNRLGKTQPGACQQSEERAVARILRMRVSGESM